MSERVVLHLDMDAFYASVEQRERPGLRGKPVIVGADPQDGQGRGVVAAASYEARRYGIHSAQPISQAWRACPQGVYVRPRFPIYEEASQAIFELVEGSVDVLEQVSIDEAYADVTERVGADWDAGTRLADALRKRVKTASGLTCSIGVGPNKLVAKIASDEDKPDGLTVVRPGEVEGFLSSKPARVIPGVGPKTEAALSELGIQTVGELAQADPARMAERFGVWGPEVVERAKGHDDRPVDPSWERKSVGAERTFLENLSPEEAREAVTEVANQTVQGLRELEGQGRTIAIKVRVAPFETFTRQRTLPAPTDELEVVERVALELFDEAGIERDVRLIGIRVSGLEGEDGRQLTLDRWPADGGAHGLDPRAWERDAYWRFL